MKRTRKLGRKVIKSRILLLLSNEFKRRTFLASQCGARPRRESCKNAP